MSGWRPADGETVAGVVVDLTDGISKQNGEPYPIITIRTDDGEEVVVHGVHQVLLEELAKRAPRAGDEISITFLGRRTPEGGGRAYSAYRVVGGQNPFTWNTWRDDDAQLPAEHATGQPLTPPPPPTTAPAPTAGQIDTRDTITPADQIAIQKLLEAMWHINSGRQDRIEKSINQRAGGPWREHLTRELGSQIRTWLEGKATEMGVDVTKTLGSSR